jgi:hypothetical protein
MKFIFILYEEKKTEIQISLASLPPPCHWRLKILAWWKIIFLKQINYFLIFNNIIKNKLKNTF